MTALDPDVATVLRDLGDLAPDPTPSAPPEVVRERFRRMIEHLRRAPRPAFDGAVTDEVVGATATAPGAPPVPVRRYTPAGWRPGGPVAVWVHGGGWVVGDLASAEPSALALATATGAQVVSVDYRLAPEHPFPGALDDCLAVVRAEAGGAGGVSAGPGPSRPRPSWLAVGGDSAGGNLAAAVALAAPAAGVVLDAALLVYPALDATMTSASHRAFAAGHLLTAEAMDYYWDAYGGPARAARPRRAGLEPTAATDLSGFPPTVITTAGFDPLRDEGDALAEHLARAGVPVTHLRAERLTHGWLDMTDRVPAALRERTRTFAALAALVPSPP